MKKQWNILRRLSGNNRGSGIVVVLVSMTCIALMGASLLFMSYTAVRMRATERQASHDFYSAETAMDEIRAGAQSMASVALGKAYKTVLLTYSEGGQMNQLFADAFVKELKKTGLISQDARTYNPDKLFTYVSNRTGVTVSGGGTIDNTNTDELVLKDITVTYTNNGYTTTISSDISIGMPDFTYKDSGNSFTGLPEHALIAQTGLVHTVGDSTINITGSAYVGSMDLQSESSQLTISNGTLVCANDAVISGNAAGGRLVTKKPVEETDSPVKFWAGRIKLTNGGTVNLNGETRVLDDLELAGGNTSATLSGSYYGFGDGTTPKSTDIPANYSSAILINGLNCNLDFSGLDHLMLAGRSYISDSFYAATGQGTTDAATGTSDAATRVGMLESIAVRSNQQMYLLDPADFVVDLDGAGTGAPGPVDQNPFIITSTSVNLLETENGSYKWIHLSEEAENRAAQYGYKLTARKYPFTQAQDVIYCFMEFTTLNAANDYFEERFDKNSNQINSYLTSSTTSTTPSGTEKVTIEYSNLNVSEDGTVSTYGYGLTGNGSATAPYDLSQPTRTQFNPSGMRSTFNQLKKTLIDGNPRVAEDMTPYKYIVNTSKVNNTLGAGEFKYFYDANDKALGVIVNNSSDYTLHGDDEQKDLCLVIASGNVTVTASEYNGLIISGGTISLEGSSTIKYNKSGVIDAFKAVSHPDANGSTEIMGTYLLHGVNQGEDWTVSGGEEGWNLDDLITYKNWTKN